MALRKYVDAITASREDNEKALAPARAKEQQALLGLEATKLELVISGAENAIADMASRYPLDVDRIIDAQDELDLNRRRLKQLRELETGLF